MIWRDCSRLSLVDPLLQGDRCGTDPVEKNGPDRESGDSCGQQHAGHGAGIPSTEQISPPFVLLLSEHTINIALPGLFVNDSTGL
ncbi:hypothetical protein EDM54_26085 [Brevibacillus borstelensis]|nr:hypothetical protein EDM54_26085 [Brevibacillus borstelensis]